MMINQDILSIPPYISVSWDQIASLHVENRSDQLVLVLSLVQGHQVEVPYLEKKILELIFVMHARVLQQPKVTVGPAFLNGLNNLEGLTPMLQHNPDRSDMPDLPPLFLNKVREMTGLSISEDPSILPQPEQGCNCVYCQVTRAMQEGVKGEAEEEEIVSDEDLKFRSFDIQQTADKLYIVSDPLEGSEQYNVFLGDTIGCTCGKQQCEHIQAVLKS